MFSDWHPTYENVVQFGKKRKKKKESRQGQIMCQNACTPKMYDKDNDRICVDTMWYNEKVNSILNSPMINYDVTLC